LTSKTEITDFFIFCQGQEKCFGELFVKIRLKLARVFLILRNPTKSRIALFAPQPPLNSAKKLGHILITLSERQPNFDQT